METTLYRQEISRDLEESDVRKKLWDFVDEFEVFSRWLKLSREVRYTVYKMGWFLESALEYHRSVEKLLKILEELKPNSKALKKTLNFLKDLVSSSWYTEFTNRALDLKRRLKEMVFGIRMRSNRIEVFEVKDDFDWVEDMERLFEAFQDEQNLEKIEPPFTPGMSHVEKEIVEGVFKLWPEVEKSLREFYEEYEDFPKKELEDFYREIRLYLLYMDHISRLRERGLSFCYPVFDDEGPIEVESLYDLILAKRLLKEGKEAVPNDLHLKVGERTVIITGPNGGGKTTFLRSIGQLFYFALLGFPVPARRARIPFVRGIHSSFVKRENPIRDRSGLEYELLKIREVLEGSKDESLILFNEILSCAVSGDALEIGKELLKIIESKGDLCFWVTFVYELSTVDDVVSMVATMKGKGRTYKIERMPADGRAFAISIVKTYSLSYEDIRRRLSR